MRKNCKHFTGFGGQFDHGCALNLNPREMIGGPERGWSLRAPCYTTSRSHDQAVCPSYDEETEEERAEQEREVADILGVLTRVQQGEMVECPKCGKPVAYREHSGGFVFGCPCGNYSGRGCSPRLGH